MEWILKITLIFIRFGSESFLQIYSYKMMNHYYNRKIDLYSNLTYKVSVFLKIDNFLYVAINNLHSENMGYQPCEIKHDECPTKMFICNCFLQLKCQSPKVKRGAEEH